MTPHEIFIEARKRGLRLEAAGDKLAIMPKGACPSEFRAVLREHKPELLHWLNSSPCPGWGKVPPSGLPLTPGEPHPAPADRERVIVYLRRQTGDRPGPLCAWLVRRECEYYDGPGGNWDCASHAYAAARDAACWQMSCTEAELSERLAAFEDIASR